MDWTTLDQVISLTWQWMKMQINEGSVINIWSPLTCQSRSLQDMCSRVSIPSVGDPLLLALNYQARTTPHKTVPSLNVSPLLSTEGYDKITVTLLSLLFHCLRLCLRFFISPCQLILGFWCLQWVSLCLGDPLCLSLASDGQLTHWEGKFQIWSLFSVHSYCQHACFTGNESVLTILLVFAVLVESGNILSNAPFAIDNVDCLKFWEKNGTHNYLQWRMHEKWRIGFHMEIYCVVPGGGRSH